MAGALTQIGAVAPNYTNHSRLETEATKYYKVVTVLNLDP